VDCVSVISSVTNREPSVVLTPRQAIFKHDHRSDLVFSSKVGHIETLHSKWRFVKTQGGLNFRQGTRPGVGVACSFGEVPLQSVGSIEGDRALQNCEFTP